MELLDKDKQRWYRYDDDEMYFAKEQRWSKEITSVAPKQPPSTRLGTGITSRPFAETWTCACGREIATTLSYNELVECKACRVLRPKFSLPSLRQLVVKPKADKRDPNECESVFTVWHA